VSLPLYRPSVTQVLSRFAYTVLVTVIWIVAICRWWSLGIVRSAKFERKRAQRYGALGQLTPRQRGGILFHCVSVGEVVAASCVIKGLLNTQPDLPIVITTTTATGAQRVRDIFGTSLTDNLAHHYLPYDLPWLMSRLLAHIQPKLVCITEVELWPNLLAKTAQKHIPVCVVNARMTAKSARTYRKISGVFMPMLQQVTTVCAQGQRDADAYLSLGLAPEKLVLTHNVKFDQVSDVVVPESIIELSNTLKLLGKQVLLAGSTHQDEETFWLDVYKQLQADFPQALLIIVPRHPQRFAQVEAEILSSGLNYINWADRDKLNAQTQVLLVDAMGVLTPLYTCADIAFVGGSIVAKGGHNALEPASMSVPVIMGIHTYNNPVICDTLITAGGLRIVTDTTSARQLCHTWLSEPALADAIGRCGQTVILDNQGALARTLTQIWGIYPQ
jgi:3-deoxy-D-manno-octulosonic-acid transferase